MWRSSKSYSLSITVAVSTSNVDCNCGRPQFSSVVILYQHWRLQTSSTRCHQHVGVSDTPSASCFNVIPLFKSAKTTHSRNEKIHALILALNLRDRQWCIHQVFRSNFRILSPWPLTSWPPKWPFVSWPPKLTFHLLHHRTLVPICSKTGSFVYKISPSQHWKWTDRRTDRQTERWTDRSRTLVPV